MHAPAGRPREFTYHKRRELLQHIQQGSSTAEAAQIVGVTLRTVQRAAKFDEFFHHDLELARHAAPVDPYKLVSHAARTHWRAAAWLLERKDPDRFGKRKPNTCRPEMLQEVSDWLIETALETVSPDQREALYKRLRGVADKACATLMPAQHEARRALEQQLPNRPLPLSEHEWQKTWGNVPDKPERISDNSNIPVPSPLRGAEQRAQSPRRLSAGGSPCEAPGRGEAQGTRAHKCQVESGASPLPPPNAAHGLPPAHSDSGRCCSLLPPRGGSRRILSNESLARRREVITDGHLADPATLVDPIAYYRENPPEPPPAERPSNYVGGFRLLDSERVDQEWLDHLAEQEDVIDFGLASDEPADFTRAAYEEDIASLPGGSPSHVGGVSASCVGGVSDADAAPPDKFDLDGMSDRGRRPIPQEENDSIEHATSRSAAPHPPTEGNMSPKIDSATSPDVAANDAAISSAAERLRDLWEWRFRGRPASQTAPPTAPFVEGPT